jgi:uncharacterized protein (DUF1330 family)
MFIKHGVNMSFERIMGIEVTNDEMYQKYRESMTPILHSFGGSFGFDFKINEVLKSKTSDVINRVFTLDFPSKEIMEEFFINPAYLAVKDKYFLNSVKSVTIISMHEKNT